MDSIAGPASDARGRARERTSGRRRDGLSDGIGRPPFVPRGRRRRRRDISGGRAERVAAGPARSIERCFCTCGLRLMRCDAAGTNSIAIRRVRRPEKDNANYGRIMCARLGRDGGNETRGKKREKKTRTPPTRTCPTLSPTNRSVYYCLP